MASGDAVEQIKNRLSIVDVVAPYVELHSAGKNMKGRSPFTAERTPSFFVSPDRGMYYCFSTSQGGDMFTFVQLMEGVDFKGALKVLAEKAGVELVPEDPKKRTERDTLHLALDEATRFYEAKISLQSEVAIYLEKRGVTKATIGKWRIGFAPDEWRAVAQHLASKNISPALLRRAGLTKGEEGKDPYDVFRGRVMFPIFDASGRVVGFSGRILAKDSEAPKYVNSPDTELFNKSEVLYGYDKAKQAIRTMNFSLIVEGQFDVVMSHQAGYGNTVAVSGTALTPQHVSLLQRLSQRCVLALDGDKAGIAAVKRAAELMLGRGMDVKVATLPDGQDPADLVQNDPATYKKAIGNAKHVIEFLLGHIRTHIADDRAFKLRVRDEVLPFVAHIESHIDREHFEGVVAKSTSSTPEAIHLEVERIRETLKKDNEKEVVKEESPISTPVSVPSKEFLGKVDTLGAMVTISCEIVPKELSAILERVVLSVTGLSAASYKETLPAEALSPLLFSLEEEYAAYDKKKLAHHLASTIEEWKQISVKVKGQELRRLHAEAESKGDTVKAEELLKEIIKMDAVRQSTPVSAVDLLEAA